MKKLYLATKTITAMFVSDAKDSGVNASKFIAEEEKNRFAKHIEIKEITTRQEIPKEWIGDAYLWGTEDEITAEGWISELGKEYQEYLRLKAKYD